MGLKKLNGIEIPCPSLETQDRLLAQASETEWATTSLLTAVNDARRRAQALRRSLLDAAFSGRLTGRASDMEFVEEMAGV